MKKISTESLDRKISICLAFIGRTENADELPWEELHNDQRCSAYCLRGSHCGNRPDVVFFGAE